MGIDTLGYTHSRLLRQMGEVNAAWWKIWEAERLLKLIPRSSKWLKGDPDIRLGDIVVFLRDGKEAAVGATPWRVGRVRELELSSDGIVRTLVIEYSNGTESKLRTTRRSVRTVAVLDREDDGDISGQISGKIKDTSIHMFKQQSRE